MSEPLTKGEKIFKICVTVINLTAASTSLLIFAVYFLKRKRTLNILPKSLRWHINTSFFLSCIFYALGSVYYCTSFLIDQSSENSTFFKIVRLNVGSFSQMIRLSLLFIMIERLIATVYLEKYTTKFSNLIIYFLLTFITLLGSILHLIPNMFWLFFGYGQTAYTITVYYIVVIHIITIIIGKILYDQNRKTYRMLAYRVSLQRRHQILENVKVLRFLWPTIFLFSCFAPIGPLLTWIYVYITGHTAPPALLHGVYNITVSIIMITHLKYIYKLNSITPIPEKRVSIVVGPLGSNLPTAVNLEAYFKSLKNEWN